MESMVLEILNELSSQLSNAVPLYEQNYEQSSKGILRSYNHQSQGSSAFVGFSTMLMNFNLSLGRNQTQARI